jgi:hypothetical protein
MSPLDYMPPACFVVITIALFLWFNRKDTGR